MNAFAEDVNIPEVAARVAYRMVIRQYKAYRLDDPSAMQCIRRAITSLPKGGFPILITALLGAQFHLLNERGLLKTWRDNAVSGSRQGLGFRRCFYNDYKANRRR